MRIKELIQDNDYESKDISLTDFMNYARQSGYIVYDNEEHWIKEYQEFIRLYGKNSK